MAKFSYVPTKEAPYRFSIQKWEDGANQPTVIYHILIRKNNQMECDCPAGARLRACKHLKMVIIWLEKGMPEMFAIDDKEV